MFPDHISASPSIPGAYLRQVLNEQNELTELDELYELDDSLSGNDSFDVQP